jgi:hypothetical protein
MAKTMGTMLKRSMRLARPAARLPRPRKHVLKRLRRARRKKSRRRLRPPAPTPKTCVFAGSDRRLTPVRSALLQR